MKHEKLRIPPEAILYVTEMVYQTLQTQLKCSLILSVCHPTLTVYSHIHLLTQFVKDYPKSSNTFKQNEILFNGRYPAD